MKCGKYVGKYVVKYARMIYIHFSRISTANQEKEPAISIEENTNFNRPTQSTKQRSQKDQFKKINSKVQGLKSCVTTRTK